MIVKTDCTLINLQKDEMGVKQDGTKAEFAFLLSQVESIREVITEDDSMEINPLCCRVYMKSGDSTTIDMPFYELLKLWEDSFKC